MKLHILQRALKAYAISAEGIEHTEEIFDAIEELAEIKERYVYADIWKNDVTVISMQTLDDILNELTYDILGKRMRVHDGQVNFSYYANGCRKESWALESLTDRQLLSGYYYLKDLWQDNEYQGDNRADGTFNCRKPIGTLAHDYGTHELLAAVLMREKNQEYNEVCDMVDWLDMVITNALNDKEDESYE